MSRSGYDDCDGDGDQWQYALYAAQIANAKRGKKGQKFFQDLILALDDLPAKELVADELETASGAVCALGALGKARGIDMKPLDPNDADTVADVFKIAACLARETVFQNDDNSPIHESDAERWTRMRAWAVANLKPAA